PGSTAERSARHPRRGPPHAGPRPPPHRVDVMRQRDEKPRTVGARRLEAERPAQTFDRRIERIETRPCRAKPSVLVAAPPTLLDAREVEEGVRERVADRSLAALDGLPR